MVAKIKIQINGKTRAFKKGVLDLSKLSLKEVPHKLIAPEIKRDIVALDLSKNDIIEIEGFDGFPRLETLKFNNNAIVEIKNLEPLKSLSNLNLGHNHISEIKNLDCLPQLTSLNLFGNKISKITGLDKLVNLTSLNLSDNNIQSIEGLGNLVKLEFLALEDNPLNEIKGLEKLENLKWLFLDDKYISRRLIDDLGGFKENKAGPGTRGYALVKKPQEFVNYCKNIARIMKKTSKGAHSTTQSNLKGKKNPGYK